MPEIKHNFTGGKMNKDVDERLVPKGEYRDAMNIQVSTSEGSDVGTIQNILGNNELTNIGFTSGIFGSANYGASTCVGSISDEKNDTFYWFIREPKSVGAQRVFTDGVYIRKDMILSHNKGLIQYVFVDIAELFLQVDGNTTPSINFATGEITLLSEAAYNQINVGDNINYFQGILSGINYDEGEIISVISKDNNGGSGPYTINVGSILSLTVASVSGQALTINTSPSTAGVLKFPLNSDNNPKQITAINIIDDLLFWTDGVTEPKKISIPRSVEGTDQSGLEQTLLINPEQNISIADGELVEEKHITVIRKAPKNTLIVETSTTPDFGFGLTIPTQSFLINPSNPVQGNLLTNSQFDIALVIDPLSNNPLSVGDTVLFNPLTTSTGAGNNLPSVEHEVSVSLTALLNTGSTPLIVGGITMASAGTYQVWSVTVVAIASWTSPTPQLYNWAQQYDTNQNFKSIFPRFSYRYKYQDGEYSTFAPFTSVVFETGDFRYDPTEAYNIGMENTITQVTVRGYEANMPEDVISIDLLYKESNSPAVYTVDTLKTDYITVTNASYTIKSHQIRAMLPENQLLRAWDNVPRNSLAQEVSGSRIIYGNYLQNYNLASNPKLQVKLVNRRSCDLSMQEPTLLLLPGYKSLKSIRNYSLGISYLDGYGRQTPVFTDKEANIEVPIERSDRYNQIVYEPIGAKPPWATHYKVFIKETSNEYYNLAMDRVYDAKDGNVWLSFPSSERNKVDEETFLILKKGVEGSEAINENNRYKILAIENEAPTFIKTEQFFVAEAQEDASTTTFEFFNIASGYPVFGNSNIKIVQSAWDGLNIPLVDVEKMAVRFSRVVFGQKQLTDLYDVSTLNLNATSGAYELTLNKQITETWLNDPLNTSQPDPSVGIVVFKKVMENRAEFDGRFFVKVSRDILIDTYIIQQAITSLIISPQPSTQIQFYYLADQSNPSTSDNTTSAVVVSGGGTVGNLANSQGDWKALFDPEGSGIQSMWFIDAAYRRGYFEDDNTLQNCGIIGCNNTYHVLAGKNDPATKIEDGYNNGIYEEAGQTYIDLSYGYIKAADGPANNASQNFAMHTDGTDSSRINTCIDTMIGNNPSSSLGAWCQNENSDGGAYFQEIGDNNDAGILDDLLMNHMWKNQNNLIKHWKIGSSLNPQHNSVNNQEIVQTRLQAGQKFYFQGDPSSTIYKITASPVITYSFNYKNMDGFYNKQNTFYQNNFSSAYFNTTSGPTAWGSALLGAGFNTAQAASDLENMFDEANSVTRAQNKRVTWKIPIAVYDADSLAPDNPTDATSSFNPINSTTGASATDIGTMVFIEEVWGSVEDQVVASDPAIWETEPKKDVDLDIYYEVDGAFPFEINNETNYTFAPIGTIVRTSDMTMLPGVELSPGVFSGETRVVSWDNNIVTLDADMNTTGDPFAFMGELTFHRPDGSCVRSSVQSMVDPVGLTLLSGVVYHYSSTLNILSLVENNPVNLSWHNCYSFGNGVESDRVRDDYNQVKIDKGAKASSTLDEPYKEERRKYGLIYSGLYNSTSGVNNLNEFNSAEKITKDINPIYGSIQKLHSRSTADGDLIALCEDRCLKILANKDAVFNADGNTNLTSTSKVLGQTIPYTGEYGISTNPESFASESYRVYFTDKVRGAVMRLSKDGLTPISDHGMKDWFRDNLKLNTNLIGSYDDKKDEYNISLIETNNTVSFREDVKGWVSFKSFVPENGISCANEYYTFDKGDLYVHHSEDVDRNQFYGMPNNSSFSVILNQVPGTVKSFNTLNYEGSDCRITQNLEDNEYYNLAARPGWYVENITTDLEKGSLNEFIEKEGKWFNYIKGKNITTTTEGLNTGGIIFNDDGGSSFDHASFAIQGLGSSNLEVLPNGGCTDPAAFNFDPIAVVDDGSCIPVINGCTEIGATNFISSSVNTDDGSCEWVGCTCPPLSWGSGCTNTASFVGNADALVYGTPPGSQIFDDGSCIEIVEGCTDPIAFNYNSAANTDDGSCIAVVLGCTIPSADNVNLATANTDDGTCTWYGCAITVAPNYGFQGASTFPPEAVSYVAFAGNQYGIQDDGSCLGGGCMLGPTTTSYNLMTDTVNDGGPNSNFTFYEIYNQPSWPSSIDYVDLVPTNYDSSVAWENGTCLLLAACGDPLASNYNPAVNISDESCIYPGCTDSNAENYDATANFDDGSCVYSGCTVVGACNYSPIASIDDGSCVYDTCSGCMDSTMFNQNYQASWVLGDLPLPCLVGSTNITGDCTNDCSGVLNGSDNGCCVSVCMSIPGNTLGCMDPTSCNYDADATCPGPCDPPPTVPTYIQSSPAQAAQVECIVYNCPQNLPSIQVTYNTAQACCSDPVIPGSGPSYLPGGSFCNNSN
tara:strand:- start:898 stop:7971 length:7074 start_codon:yes stop_codon:yes gene_type:complete